jgi:DNA-binding CsgD family transcriptional regulator
VSGPYRRQGRLLGRTVECAELDRRLTGLRGGGSGALVLQGEPGIGKTALLEHLSRRAVGCRVVRIAGNEAEAELAFASLHQACAPFLDRLDRLAEPQRLALEGAFGMRAGPPAERFLVGLAVLALLTDAAREAPLLCLVDDAQWLDQVSSQTLAFVARRLRLERILFVFAVRATTGPYPFADLPHLTVDRLGDHDSRELLATATPAGLDERIRERLLAEARGNPLALTELPKVVSLPGLLERDEARSFESTATQVEQSFLLRLEALREDTQRFVTLAAVEPVGDLALLERAARALGLEVDRVADEAQATELVHVRPMVRFLHPLVRSAALRKASPEERRAAHRALADAIDPREDFDRRIWHLAYATSEPDESVAADLEAAAGRAHAQGAVAAEAALLEQAVLLTPDPGRRSRRALAAASAKAQAGQYDTALELLDTAQLLVLDEDAHAMAELVRGRVLFASRSASAGLPVLVGAAKALEARMPDLARDTYRDALYAGLTAGRLDDDSVLQQVAQAVRSMPEPTRASRADALLRGLATVVADGYGAGVGSLRHAIRDYTRHPVDTNEAIAWLPLACRMAHDSFEFDAWSTLSETLVAACERSGALSVMPSALLLRLSNRVYAGELGTAAALAERAADIGDAYGGAFFAGYSAMVMTPWLGDEEATLRVLRSVTGDRGLEGEGKATSATAWAAAVLYNGLGRFEEAFAAGRAGIAHLAEMGLSTWSVVEMVEAASKLGIRDDDVRGAVDYLQGLAAAAQTDWALGAATLVTAQVTGASRAEAVFREAISHAERTGVHMLTARAHLLLGEWLLEHGSRTEGRPHLRRAHDMLSRFGAHGYAARAARGLASSGAPVESPRKASGVPLTGQEQQIAALAADGLTNPQIAAAVHLSAHTVEWHLRKIFTKLGVRSRREIAGALGALGSSGVPGEADGRRGEHLRAGRPPVD